MPGISLYIDPFSFWFGFIAGAIFFGLVTTFRSTWQTPGHEAVKKAVNTKPGPEPSIVDRRVRREALLRAQNAHLAAHLFPLDDILLEPRLLSPIPRIDPTSPPPPEDIISQTIAYLPDWPELAAEYGGATMDFFQPLAAGVNLLVIGQSGAGKTVALAYLASLAARKDPRLGALAEYLPIYAHINDLIYPTTGMADPDRPLVDFLAKSDNLLSTADAQKEITSSIESGKIFLIVDGMDQLDADQLKAAAVYLGKLIQKTPAIRIVAAASSDYWDGLASLGLQPMALAVWNSQDTGLFINRWAEQWLVKVLPEVFHQDGAQAVDPTLIQHWLVPENHYLTPLEWTLLTWSAAAGDNLGPRPIDAIEAYLRRVIQIPAHRNLLERAALKATMTGSLLDESDPLLAKEKPENIQPWFDNGILTRHPGKKWGFTHPMVKGYLAGRTLVADAQSASSILAQPSWTGRTLALHYFAALGDATGLVDKLLRENEGPLYRNLFLVSRWLRDVPEGAAWKSKVLRSLSEVIQLEILPLAGRQRALTAFLCSEDPGLSALFHRWFSAPSAGLRQLAVLGCGALHDPKTVAELTGMLSDESQQVRDAACLALVAANSLAGIESVARILLQGDERSRRAAAEALSNHPHEGYTILKEGSTLEDLMVRRSVVFGLVRIKEHWATEMLSKMRVEDSQFVVRSAAVQACEMLQRPDPSIPRLLPPPSQAPWLIAFVAGRGEGIPAGSTATDKLLLVLRDGTEDERLAALEYLAQTDLPQAIEEIYRLISKGPERVRDYALHTLWILAAGGLSRVLTPSQPVN
ncbi:MAG: HEAT repeat domain-containing protein [Chloroflexi bacterium]|nr:HEAT repeat domain-containing protein [Chloroflexota bacterium]